MPQNKKAYQRIKALDAFFSSGGRMSKVEIIKFVSAQINNRDTDDGDNTYSERQVDYDIQHMRNGEYGLKAPLKYSRKDDRYYYSVEGFSLFNKDFDGEEKNALAKAIEILDGIGQKELSGQLSLIYLRGDEKGKVDHTPILSYEQHPDVMGLHWVNKLYQFIKEKQPIQLEYQPYDQEEEKDPIVSPYLLKQYRYRWYLIGYDGDRKSISNFGLDRIVSAEAYKYATYKEPVQDWDTYFNDIIGLTLYDGSVVEKVVFKANATLSKYIHSRPLHHSQRLLRQEDNGWTFELNIRKNIELLAEFRRFGASLEVLEPLDLRAEMLAEWEKAVRLYKKA